MGKNIMVLGSGGREHALVWKISQSTEVAKIFCIPGNAGIAEEDKTSILQMDLKNFEAIIDFAKASNIALTVVGPEAPLVAGIVDEFQKAGLKIFGPKKAAAQLEGSKIFAKNMMKKYNIPTSDFQSFHPDEIKSAIDYAHSHLPCAVKADRLAAGKGVILVRSEDEASKAIERIFIKKEFGDTDIIIEELLIGEEATYMVFTDGYHISPMPATQDHKPIFDDDRGPNTGGMGAYAPAPIVNSQMEWKITEKIIDPLFSGLQKDNIIYQGVLYIGLMITSSGPKVLEFNCRFGDPEAEPLVMLLETDIVEIFESIILGNLDKKKIKWQSGASVAIVMASDGYPGHYEKGYTISGLNNAKMMENVKVFHAGTECVDKHFVTAGGRVLCVTAVGRSIERAKKEAYKAVGKISWIDEYHRADIAEKAMKHLKERV